MIVNALAPIEQSRKANVNLPVIESLATGNCSLTMDLNLFMIHCIHNDVNNKCIGVQALNYAI